MKKEIEEVKKTDDQISQECADEIAAVLEKFGCEINAQFIVGTGSITPFVRIVKKPVLS